MRYLSILFLLLGLVFAGCTTGNDDDDLANFIMNFTDFGVHQGDMLYLKVVDTSTDLTVGEVDPFEVTTESFSVTIPNIIREGVTYQVDYYADVDGNGIADKSPIGDPAGVDHTWRRTGVGTAAGLTINYAHSTDFTDITPFE